MEKLKWNTLTSHQKNAKITLDPGMTLKEVQEFINSIETPFTGPLYSLGKSNLTATLENDMTVLKVHAQFHGPLTKY